MIVTRNTNTAMWPVYDYIQAYGIKEKSRNGLVLYIPHPVTIEYQRPYECVNFCPTRDANPFFHFMEMLWFLEAKGDVKFIAHYLPRMVEYSDNGTYFNAHYGYNIRHRFEFDQLKAVIHQLKENPNTRQAVVQIWNPQDLLKITLDKACNMSLVFAIRNGKLYMTVFNRSNDAIWGGVSGANITNLFIFQHYVARMLDIAHGSIFICSNNLHVYLDNPKTKPLLEEYTGKEPITVQRYQDLEPYSVGTVFSEILINSRGMFDGELVEFMTYLRENNFNPPSRFFYNRFFSNTANPLIQAYENYKLGDIEHALYYAKNIQATDWQLACVEWLKRRAK